MSRKSREADSGQMEFDFQAPPPPELAIDPEAEKRRVDQILFNRHAIHVDGRGGRTTEINGGRSTIYNTGGGTQVSSSSCGEAGEAYRFDPFSRPPDITNRQAARIGLLPSRPKTDKTAASPASIQEYSDLIFHYQQDELIPANLENLRKMADIALRILRR